MLEETIDRLNLRNKPSSIFNCDESMATMDRKTEKVVVSHKTKQAYTNERLWISKFNSAPTYISTSLPTRSIWKRWIWLIPYSPTHLMVMWRTTLNFFVVSSTSSLSQTQNIQGPKLLILDGHGSHLSVGLIDLCRRKNTCTACHHTTHVFQPLDVVIFNPLKAKACNTWTEGTN